MRTLLLVFVGFIAAVGGVAATAATVATATTATDAEPTLPILINAREKLDAVADFDPRDPVALVHANDVFHEVGTWAAVVDGDETVRALVDLLEESLDGISADRRKHLALTDACLADIYARRLGQPEVARKRFEIAYANAKECSVGMSPQAGAGVPMLHYTYRYGLDLYLLLSNEASAESDRQAHRDRFETLLAELRTLEESLQQMGLDIEPWSEPSTDDMTAGFTGEPVEQTLGSVQPKLVHYSRPDYPDSLRTQGIEGDVVIKVLVDRDGSVASSEVLQSAHPALDDLALSSVRECRFEPGSQRGIPVRAWMAIPYRFRLSQTEEPDTE